jgi:glycosyltransferase involved in cell wall biosynthesis
VGNALGQMSVAQLRRDFLRRVRRDGDALAATNQDGVNVVRSTGLYLLPPNPALDPYWWVSAGLAGYRRYVEAFGAPDLIHAHNALNAGLLAAQIRRRFGTPYVLTEHSSYYHQGLAPRSLRARVRDAVQGAARHTVVSAAVRTSLETWAGSLGICSAVLPNVLPAAFETACEARKPGRGFTVLSVGNLLPVKGHAHLVRAFAQFLPGHRDARLRIAGDGPLRPQLEALAAELGVAEAVQFLGLLPAEAVRGEMLRADVLALPSLHETFGVVLIEAMACGLPILATRCGGPNDIVSQDAGWLVEPGDAGALAEGLERAYAERGRLRRDAVREHCLALYGREAFAHRAGQLYEDALDG